MRLHTLVIVLAGAAASPAAAQRPIPYPVTPSPEFARAVARGTRTLEGRPGPGYWQQWTDYALHATLDPDGRRVTGRAEIRYHNRAPMA